jgi:hypothetical protein
MQIARKPGHGWRWALFWHKPLEIAARAGGLGIFLRRHRQIDACAARQQLTQAPSCIISQVQHACRLGPG